MAEAQLEIIRGGDERYVCGRDPGALQPQWSVAVPPESHRPRLRLDETIRQLVGSHTQGLTVREVRTQVYEAAAQFPGETVDAARIDSQLFDLLSQRALESAQSFGRARGPLPDDLIISPPQGADRIARPSGPQPISFGPSSASQICTDVVSRLATTARLSSVSLTYRCTVRGADLAVHRDLIGDMATAAGDASLTLHWTLSDAPVTDRTGLLTLLNDLPHRNLCEVTIQLRRESAS